MDPPTDRPAGPFAFVLEIVAPWFGRTARSVGLGCLLALGCGPGQRVELEGVVRDGRTGDPVAGAQITTEDGRTLETDEEGRFSVSAGEGERVVARARGRCDAHARVERGQPLGVRSYERLEVQGPHAEVELDAEVRIEVRTPCDDGAPIRWQQIAGPALGPDRVHTERGGRVLVVRTHARAELEGQREYQLEVAGELGGETTARLVRLSLASSPTGACGHAWGVSSDAGTCAGGTCGCCHADPPSPDAAELSTQIEEWRLSGMSRLTHPLTGDHPALRAECASCHSAPGFVAPATCGACHDASDTSTPHGLRVYDTVASIAGAPAEHLGSGALCASCHRAPDATGAAPHAPQADVLLGRGARLTAPLEDGAHRFIVDTCVRCHMTRPAEDDPLRGRAGGHTFAIRARDGEPAFNAAACAPCHGQVLPESIGVRDWDGDGRAGSVREEHRSALARASERLRARITALGLRDRCTPARTAADVAEHQARLHLVDRSGALLGDCDASGSLDADEIPFAAAMLPRRLADAAHDLAMLRADGSAGLHNPAYAFRVIDSAVRALQ